MLCLTNTSRASRLCWSCARLLLPLSLSFLPHSLSRSHPLGQACRHSQSATRPCKPIETLTAPVPTRVIDRTRLSSLQDPPAAALCESRVCSLGCLDCVLVAGSVPMAVRALCVEGDARTVGIGDEGASHAWSAAGGRVAYQSEVSDAGSTQGLSEGRQSSCGRAIWLRVNSPPHLISKGSHEAGQGRGSVARLHLVQGDYAGLDTAPAQRTTRHPPPAHPVLTLLDHPSS